MPAVSKAQQKFFGIVRAIQKGEMAPTTPETAKAAADMKKKDVKDFASTKHKGLPSKMNSEETKYDRYDSEKKRFAKSDARMKYGKNFKKFTKDVEAAKNRLRPGEVKKWDPVQKKYVSNKD